MGKRRKDFWGKWKGKAEVLLTCLLLAGAFLVGRAGGQLQETVAIQQQEKEAAERFGILQGASIVVDCGHGGDDPGKIGAAGTREKEINLAIGQKVKAFLESYGCTVTMTRTTDAALCDDSTENKKQQDMKNRCRIIDETGADLTVSIHQNSYTDPGVKGPQVFYYEHSEEGRKAASCIQDALNTMLDVGRPREIKANDTYYLLKRTKSAVLIVECGFLSCPEEEEKLNQESYQQMVAEAVCAGAADYLNGKKE